MGIADEWLVIAEKRFAEQESELSAKFVTAIKANAGYLDSTLETGNLLPLSHRP